jgi:hypothetical protein
MLPVCALIWPMTQGLTMPLVMPMLEMKAMPVAAVWAGRWRRQRPEDRQRGEDQHGGNGQDRQRHPEARHMQRQRGQRQRASCSAAEKMPVTLAEAVGAPRNEDQAHRADGVRDDRVEADGHHVLDAEVANHQRHPE